MTCHVISFKSSKFEQKRNVMTRYTSLGELLIDYRYLNKISQSDLAAEFDVDIRTIIRWEKNETLLKPEKEEAMVDVTFIPYQVVRNLNAPVSIPTYYDLALRKYSLSKMSNQLPEANWLKDRLNIITDRVRTIQFDSDIENIIRCVSIQHHINKPLNKEVIKKAISILPELNLVMFDASNYYSGHSVFLPLSNDCFMKLRNREMVEENIEVSDLVDYKKLEKPIFYAYDINSDCNENLFYISSKIITFFKGVQGNYLYGAFVSRTDSYSINNQLGVEVVWEDKEEKTTNEQTIVPRFYEGNFTKYLSK